MRQRETERWTTVPKLSNLTDELNSEWQSKYMVSSLGKIRSNKSKRILKPTINKKGYHLLATKRKIDNDLNINVQEKVF